MKKVFLTSVASLAIVLPAFADINKNASTATCDSATIGTTSGDANLQAAWQANTINLQWYSNGEQINVTGTDSATCTYDDVITLPSTPTVPTGYTFGGWRVRVAAAPAQTTFDLSTLAQYIGTGGSDYYARSKYDEDDYCFAYGENTVFDDEGTYVCTEDSGMSDIALNQWKTVFSYGTVRGIAYCSAKSGNNHDWSWGGNSSDWTATESELTSASEEAKYCWCKPTGFDAEKDGTYQNVASSSWVFVIGMANAVGCAVDCAANCADYLGSYDDFRPAVFGVQ